MTSHALSHREALDVLLLDNRGDGGGSFAVLAGNVYDPLAFLILLDDFLLHRDGYGRIFRRRLRRQFLWRHDAKYSNSDA